MTSKPELLRLLAEARKHAMTEEEVREQRESWVRGELAIGNDEDEARFREEMRASLR